MPGGGYRVQTVLALRLRPRYITLLQNEIEQLILGGGTITDRPAWVAGDELFVPWADILAFRAANQRVLGEFDEDQGEWMGESDTYFLSKFVGVKSYGELRVPRHSVGELVRIFSVESDETADERKGGELVGIPPGSVELEWGDEPLVQLADPVRGIEKSQVLIAFGALLPINLKLALSDPDHIFGDGGARVQRGTRGRRHKSLWDPVILAVGVYERYQVPRRHLTRMFAEHAFLAPWREEWLAQAESLP